MADTQAEAPQAPIRRMIIQRIVQENFKSYAGRVEIGPFHKVAPARLARAAPRKRWPLTGALLCTVAVAACCSRSRPSWAPMAAASPT